MAVFELGFGHSTQAVIVPEGHVAAVLRGTPTRPVADVDSAIAAAVRQPVASVPLAQLVLPGDKVCIIVSDITRSWIGFAQFLPSVLNELNALGISDQDITLLVALGAHRRHTPQEHVATYGAEVVGRVRIEQSDAQEEADFVYTGTTSFGTKAYLNKHAVHADKVILTGAIAYHSMAGFGGGRKGVVPGIARYSTIQENHQWCLNSSPGTGISDYAAAGNLASNVMHKDLMEMAAMLRPTFLINALHAPEGGFAGFVAGDWEKAWLAGCETITAIYGVPFAARADIVIASAGGAPKDINLYQGTKAMDNACLAVKETGVVILVLACPEIGEPPDFSAWFECELLQREAKLRDSFTVPGFVALKCGCDLCRIPHLLVTLPQNKEFVEKAGFLYMPDLEQAFSQAVEMVKNPEYTVIVMPDGANTVPQILANDRLFPGK